VCLKYKIKLWAPHDSREQLNADITPVLLPEMILQGARDFLGKATAAIGSA
jgi:hypothetical protein